MARSGRVLGVAKKTNAIKYICVSCGHSMTFADERELRKFLEGAIQLWKLADLILNSAKRKHGERSKKKLTKKK